MTTEHLDSDLVAAYAERRLDATHRALVEGHLAECAECRREVADVTTLLGAAPQRPRLTFLLPGLAAAALVTVVITTGRFAPRPDSERDRLRPGADSLADQIGRLAAYHPGADAEVTREQLRFVWSRDGGNALYDITLADSSGLPAWQARTSDTTLAPPDSLRLIPGARYHWWVDVLLPDGRMATTGSREFVLRP